MENVEWLPGAIVLLTQEELKEPDINSPIQTLNKIIVKRPQNFTIISKKNIVKFPRNLLMAPPPSIDGSCRLRPVYFSNFDITTMLPVDGTRHKLLR